MRCPVINNLNGFRDFNCGQQMHLIEKSIHDLVSCAISILAHSYQSACKQKPMKFDHSNLAKNVTHLTSITWKYLMHFFLIRMNHFLFFFLFFI